MPSSSFKQLLSGCTTLSQVESTIASIEVGYDTAKQVRGRKRHFDTLGFVLMVVVTAASVPKRAGAKLVSAQLARVHHWFKCLVLIWLGQWQLSGTKLHATGAR